MPKTTTCFDVIFKGSKARDCFSWAVLIPGSGVAGHQTYRSGRSHSLRSQKRAHGCFLSFRLCCSLIANRATHRLHSLAEPKVHSQPSFVLALRAASCVMDILLSQIRAHWHATQKSCTVRFDHCVFSNRAKMRHSRLHSLCSFRLDGERRHMIAMEILQSCPANTQPRRFYLSFNVD